MKKILILLLLSIVFSCIGCTTELYYILEGTFVSDDITGKFTGVEYFSKLQYTISEISKEKYDLSCGQNTFIGQKKKDLENNRYLEIEMYLYSNETNKYEFVNITNMAFRKDTVYRYVGEFSVLVNDNLIDGEIALQLSCGKEEGFNNTNHGNFYIENQDFCYHGCANSTTYPIVIGSGISEEEKKEMDGHEYFTEIRYDIYEITKEEYEESKGVNTFIDSSYKRYDVMKYLKIDVYVFLKETENYELVTIKNIENIKDDWQIYLGDIVININEEKVEGTIEINFVKGLSAYWSTNCVYIKISNYDFSFSTYFLTK